MQITILTTSFPRFDGDFAGNFILKYARELSLLDCDARAVAPHDPQADPAMDSGRVKTERFKYFFPPKWQMAAYGGGIANRMKRNWLTALQMPFFLVAFLSAALRAARKSDLLHAHWTISGLVGIAVKALTDRPLVVTLWGSDMLLLNIPIIRPLFNILLSSADAVVCESSQFKDRLTGLGFPAGKISVIPNGIDLEMFAARDKLQARERLGLALDKAILLTAGRLEPEKGQKYLLEALPEVFRNDENAVCVLVGDGQSRGELEALGERLGIGRRLIFAGQRDHREMPLWLSAADIFVLPSLSEGNPNIVLEASACGLPVVASGVGGLSEMVRDGVDGLLVPAGDIPALARAVLSLIHDPELRQRFSQNARGRALESQWTWEAQARALKEVYRRVLDKRHKPAEGNFPS